MERIAKPDLVRLLARPWRLLALALLVALLFPTGRLYVLIVILGVALWALLRAEPGRRPRWAVRTLVIAAAILCLQTYAYVSWRRSVEAADATQPLDLSVVPDGTYEGRGRGANGEVGVAVRVASGRIAEVRVTESREPVYVFDEILPRLVDRTTTALPEANPLLLRSQESLRGLEGAIEDALRPAAGRAPVAGPVVRAAFFVTRNEPGRIAVNALAILFIVVLAFDYALGPVLHPGTGQALTCYNCQACVGVCPVKSAEGYAFPVTMVTETRLGRFDNVERLARYCVGCGRCAAKCPVGNSGPSIASAAMVRRRRLARAAGAPLTEDRP